MQLLEGGIALDSALSFLQGAGLSKKARAFAALGLEFVRSGRPLSQALASLSRGPKNAAFCTLLLAGEEGGFLTLSLQKACQLLSRELKLQRSANTQLAYPLFLATLCFAVAGFFLGVIAPTLEPLFAGQTGASSALFTLSQGFRQWGFTSLICLTAISAAFVLLAQTTAGRNWIRKMIQHAPVVSSIARERAFLWLFQTLALLAQARIDLSRALALICEMAEGNVAKPSDANVTKPSDANVAKPSEGNTAKLTKGDTSKFAQSTANEFAQSTANEFAQSTANEFAQSTANEFAQSNANECEWRSLLREVNEGAFLSDAFAKQPGATKLAVDLLRLGEMTGDLINALERVACFYELRHFRRLERCARYLQPALLLVVGALVACMAWLVLEPLTAIHLLAVPN